MFEVSCKELAQKIKDGIRGNGRMHLHIIGNGSSAGNRYIKNKLKVAAECGIMAHLHVLNLGSYYDGCGDWQDISKLVNDIEKSPIKGPVIVQMPFGHDVDENISLILNTAQDADGLTENAYVDPATAQGIYTLLAVNNLLKNKHVVIIGRSKLVGKPLARLLSNTDATVTLCHSKTPDLPSFTRQADVIVVAIGKEKFLTKAYVNQDKEVHIVDVGINSDANGKLCGDVHPELYEMPNIHATPVPGGVGLLTTACLMQNVKTLTDRYYHND